MSVLLGNSEQLRKHKNLSCTDTKMLHGMKQQSTDLLDKGCEDEGMPKQPLHHSLSQSKDSDLHGLREKLEELPFSEKRVRDWFIYF